MYGRQTLQERLPALGKKDPHTGEIHWKYLAMLGFETLAQIENGKDGNNAFYALRVRVRESEASGYQPRRSAFKDKPDIQFAV